MRHKFLGEVKGGKFNLFPTQAWNFEKHVKLLKDGNYEIQIEKMKRYRSDRQRKYYWGVIIKNLAYEFGYSKDEMNEAIKIRFLSVEEPGKPTYVRSTSDLSTKEFEELCEDIRRWAAMEYGISVQEPNEEE